MDSSLDEVKKALTKAVKTRIPKEKFGILFSGGLDSVLIARICRELKADFICYTIGFVAGAPRSASHGSQTFTKALLVPFNFAPAPSIFTPYS